MAAVKKQDSNSVATSYAEELSIGVLPGTPVWNAMEPNTFSDFGGDVKTVARRPINSDRQRQKGVVVDVDAAGGLEADLTLINQDLLQGFFFANFRRKGEEAVTSVDGATERYAMASTAGLHIGNTLFASGFTNAANNGLKRVTAVVKNTNVTVSTDLTAETPAAGAKVVAVGHQFNTAEVNVVITSGLPTIVNVGNVAATGALTLTGNAVNNETVTIGTVSGADRVYTWKTTLTGAANEVLIGATASISIDNLIAAINAAAGAGSIYGTGTVVHADVSAAAGAGDTMDATSRRAGANGNLITTTETMTLGSWGGAALVGGVGTSMLDLDLNPGEWLYIGSDTAGERWVNAVNNNYARVLSVVEDVITFDKSQTVMIAETGTGLTVRLYFGRVVKNEADTVSQIRRTYQLERTLGASDDAQPTQIQSEYLVGACAAEVSFNFQGADKVMLELSFVALDNEQRTGVQGLKSGTRPVLAVQEAFNTTSDFSRLKMNIVDTASATPTALFAFLTNFKIMINNNLQVLKAIGTMGGFEVTAGTFDVDGEAECYFSDIPAVQAVRNNSDVTMDFILAKSNKGVAVDLPLVALGGGKLRIEQDQPIKLPLTMPAAKHGVFNHTLMMVFFDYLPTVAT